MSIVPRRRSMPVWAEAGSLGLSLVAVAVASYLTVTHYTDPTALACPDTGIVNCTLVTTSSWSVVAGVPLAVLGLGWALVMAGLCLPWAWRSPERWVDDARLVVSAAGAGTVVYLVYVELFRLGAICLWCTAIHVTAVCLFGVVLAGRAAAPISSPVDGSAGTVDRAVNRQPSAVSRPPQPPPPSAPPCRRGRGEGATRHGEPRRGNA